MTKIKDLKKDINDTLGEVITSALIWQSQNAGKSADTDALVDEISLLGPKERIRERLQDWKKSGVTTLMIGHRDHFDTSIETMEFIANEVV